MSIWVHIISKNLDDNFNYGLEQTGTRFFQWTVIRHNLCPKHRTRRMVNRTNLRGAKTDFEKNNQGP